jgi:hypothetical protein
MRRFMLSLGICALVAALGDVILGPLFLAEPADRAIALLFASGLFTIAIAAVVRR